MLKSVSDDLVADNLKQTVSHCMFCLLLSRNKLALLFFIGAQLKYKDTFTGNANTIEE